VVVGSRRWQPLVADPAPPAADPAPTMTVPSSTPSEVDQVGTTAVAHNGLRGLVDGLGGLIHEFPIFLFSCTINCDLSSEAVVKTTSVNQFSPPQKIFCVVVSMAHRSMTCWWIAEQL
jgi:hypothetical protein